MVDNVLSSNPKSVYSFIRKMRKTDATLIDRLDVDGETYYGGKVADGFYQSMSSLKACNEELLAEDPYLAHHFENYNHILKMCSNDFELPEISLAKAAEILKKA